MIAAALVIAFSGGTADTEGGGARTGTNAGTHQRVSGPRCVSAKRAVAFYSRRVSYWRNRMGHPSLDVPAALQKGCPKYLSKVLRAKAYAARESYGRWHDYHYRWDHWLPQKWYRIARCETGVRWDWNSGTYQGAFGFYTGTWDAYRPRGAPSEAYLATPRQQYQAALNVYAEHGYGAWGCGGA